MTWDEAINGINGYRHLAFDKRRKMIELSTEAQRMFESFAVEVGPSADTVPKVTCTVTGDLLMARDPYENITNRFNAAELGYLQNDTGAVAEAYGFLKADEERYKRKEEKAMKKETRTKELPVNLGRFESDIDIKASMSDAIYHPEYVIFPAYDRVIFNDPATIILWKDKTKTVVKCGPDDTYDPEKGLAMCLLKKLCGNDGTRFHQTIRSMMKSYEPPVEESESLGDALHRIREKLEEMSNKEV